MNPPSIRPAIRKRAHRGTVFFDRDGTLNREQSFVRSVDQLHVLPCARPAVALAVENGFAPIVLTNQSGIARGLYGHRELARIHEALHAALDRQPWAYLHCPHHPDQPGPWGGSCCCRKPAGGLIDQARDLFALDLTHSCVIGDAARDLLMARHVPSCRRVLVRSGKPWRDQVEALERAGAPPDHIADDAEAAVHWFADQPGSTR